MTEAVTGRIELRAFTREHLDGAMALFAAEGWQTYTAERKRTFRALAAPGSTSIVAVDDGAVVALIQLQSDGEIQAHLSALVVAEGGAAAGLRAGCFAKRCDGPAASELTSSPAPVTSTWAWVRGRFRVFASRGRAWDWPAAQPHPRPQPQSNLTARTAHSPQTIPHQSRVGTTRAAGRR